MFVCNQTLLYLSTNCQYRNINIRKGEIVLSISSGIGKYSIIVVSKQAEEHILFYGEMYYLKVLSYFHNIIFFEIFFARSIESTAKLVVVRTAYVHIT